MYIENLCSAAKKAEMEISQLSTKVKNDILLKAAQALLDNQNKILEIKKTDV